MANERDRLKILKEIENAQKTIARIESNVNDTIEERNAKSRAYKLEIISLAKELKKVNQEQLNAYSSAEAGLGSISGAYSNLKDLQIKFPALGKFFTGITSAVAGGLESINKLLEGTRESRVKDIAKSIALIGGVAALLKKRKILGF